MIWKLPVKAAAERWGIQVIPIDAAGFYGSKNFGNRIAGEAMIKYVVGGSEPEPPPVDPARPELKVHDINLIGEYNIAGELWNTLPLFDELGLRVLCSMSGDAGSGNPDHAPRRGEHGGLLSRHAECRSQATGAIRHTLV